MRLDPIMIVVCDNPDCLDLAQVNAKEVVRNQMAISCGWARGGLESYVDRVLKVSGWNVLPDEDFCPKCFGKEQENGNTSKTSETST